MAETPIVFKCGCMTAEVTTTCPARLPGEPIERWMALVSAAVFLDHRRRSPTCQATAMEYAKIALHEGRPIGAPLNG